jgi:6-phosphogluconolactonase
VTRRLVLEDPSREAAKTLAVAIGAGGNVVLTGGSSPIPAYERLASMEIDWTACTLWFGDERCVEPDDERSNFGMVRERLLGRVAGPAPEVRRMRGELGPREGAADYEEALRSAFGAGPPIFDLVLLGLGSDGHCASLFPNQGTLDERERMVVGVEQAGLEPFVPRISLSLPAINAAKEVLFLVTGADKASAVARAFEEEPDRSTPASLVAPASGRLTVLLDERAASELSVGSGSTRRPADSGRPASPGQPRLP